MSKNRAQWGKSYIDDVEYSLSQIRLIRCTQDMRDSYLINQQMPREYHENAENTIPKQRVILFQSTDAKIIDTLLMKSRRLRQMIKMLPSFGCVPKNDRTNDQDQVKMREKLTRNGEKSPEEIYNFFSLPASTTEGMVQFRLNYKEVFEAKNLHDPQYGLLYRCTPVFELLNFQDFDGKTQKEMLRMFLENECFRDSVLLISSTVTPKLEGYSDAVEVIHVSIPLTRDIMEILDERVKVRRKKAKIKKALPTDYENVLMMEANSLLGLPLSKIEDVSDTMRLDAGFCCEAEATSTKARSACRKIRQKRIRELRSGMQEEDNVLQGIDCTDAAYIACPPGYCQWLDMATKSFKDPNHALGSGEGREKGLLMAGPPGTGKTIMAKYTARRLGVPLMQMMVESVKDKWQGETQNRMKMYLRQVEAMKPCVMVCDEIDKVLQESSSDSKTDTEIRAILLKWLQDNNGDVFCFFTANNARNLPNALIRNGRLSNRMFVFMPSAEQLARILHMQLQEASGKSAMQYGEEDEEKMLYCREFRKRIGGAEVIGDLTRLIDSITPENGDTMEDWKDSPLFFTGADMGKLLEHTNKYMNYSIQFRRKTKRTGEQRAYTFDEFSEAFLRCAKKAQPEGLRNFDSVVDCWMMMRELEFKDVMEVDEDLPKPEGCADSAEPVIPFKLYNTSYTLTEKGEAGVQKKGKPLFDLARLGKASNWRGGKPPKAGVLHHYDYFMYQLVTCRIQEIVDKKLYREKLEQKIVG